jgi:GNAT superfamily N-acetyltransferase
MAPFSIRNAALSELPRLRDLELRAAERFRGSAHPYAVALPPFDAGQLAALAGAGLVWVAADLEQLRGFAVGGHLGGSAYLHELDVDLDYGRRGVGRALVRRVASWAASEGQASLLLSTFSDVPWNAPFYAKLGFEVVPLDAYDDVMRQQRQHDADAGMLLESRVMMRAPLERLLADPSS